MIFNSQGAAELETWINGGTIIPGDEEVIIPGRHGLLGDVIIKAVQTETAEVTPGTAEQIITPSTGKFLSRVTVAGDANLIPENIAEGVDIFGVLGTHTGGVTGVDFGEITLTRTQKSVTVNHNLGVAPSFVALIPIDYSADSNVTYFNFNGNSGLYYYYRGITTVMITNIVNDITKESITFKADSAYPFRATTYKWIATP